MARGAAGEQVQSDAGLLESDSTVRDTATAHFPQFLANWVKTVVTHLE